MKLLLYLFFSLLLIGGTVFLIVGPPAAPVEPAVASWETEAQTQLATLLSTQMQAANTQDWTAFNTALAQASAHLAAAPAKANTTTFRAALTVYEAQQRQRAQLQQ